MSKAGSLIFRFDKEKDKFWWGLVSDIKGAHHREVGSEVVAALPFKEYDLTDHQFLRIRTVFNEKETIIFLPRHLVQLIFEGSDEKVLGFVESPNE